MFRTLLEQALFTKVKRFDMFACRQHCDDNFRTFDGLGG
jgi:hypothetical protein